MTRLRSCYFVILTLLLSETVTTVNSINLWNKIFNNSKRGGTQGPHASSVLKPNTCGIPKAKPLRLARIGRESGKAVASEISRVLSGTIDPGEQEISCVHCSHCINSLRGGDGAAFMLNGGNTIGSAKTLPLGLPLNAWKILFQIMLTSINVLCWLLPLRAKNFAENKLLLGLANAFSGGVFLSLAFGHLIPECVHGFDDFDEATPYMVVLFGYLLVFFFEKVAFDAHGLMNVSEKEAQATPESTTSPPSPPTTPHRGKDTSRSAVILLGALAVHSVLEMTALGLADSFSDSALLSLSIALHQPAESIALLVAFLKSGMPKDEILKFLSAFSCMGPIGVVVGMVVNEFAAPIVDAFMLAAVAGTFIYVGATEVIPEEWEDQEHKWKKFLSLLAGIGSIYVITQYTSGLEGAG